MFIKNRLCSLGSKGGFLLAFALGLPALLGHQATAGPLLHIHDAARNFGTLNVTTGEVNLIGTTPVVFTDIAFDPNGVLYGCTFNNLYEIDPETAEATLRGSLGINNMNAMVFAKDGTLFGAGGSSLYRIDPTSGSATNVGPLGCDSAGDLAFDDTGTLYLSTTSDHLIKVHTETGEGALIGSLGFSDVFGLAYGPDKVMYGVSDSHRQVFSIDLASGAGTLLSDFSKTGFTGAYGSSYTTEAVPEPNNLMLLGFGGLVLVSLMTRRGHQPARNR